MNKATIKGIVIKAIQKQEGWSAYHLALGVGRESSEAIAAAILYALEENNLEIVERK